jgi:hypothetical protein
MQKILIISCPVRYPQDNTSNPTKSQAPYMSPKNIFSRSLGKRINYHPYSRDMLWDHLTSRNVTNVMKLNVYVLVLPLYLGSLANAKLAILSLYILTTSYARVVTPRR